MRRRLAVHPDDRSIIEEASGACGDLGTFIPHVIGAMTAAGLAPAGVLLGFGLFLISTGLFYGLPLPVQPMKAVSAVVLTDGLKPGEVAAAGMLLGIVLLMLSITGWIGKLARAIPQSVSAGLQLGLGLLMGVLGVKLMLETPWIAFPSDHAAALFAIIPIGAVGALLILAGTDLAISRRLFDGKPSCRWVIGVTAPVTLTINPALGLLLGWITEIIRAAVVRRVNPERARL
jgi:hypothetical protein